MEQHETPEGLRARAAEDLRTAQIIKQADDELVSIICFHLQQYVEKSLKARLMELEIPYAKMHDLLMLVQLLPDGESIENYYFDDLIALTHYATTAKYSARSPTLEEMERSFEVAPKIVSMIK